MYPPTTPLSRSGHSPTLGHQRLQCATDCALVRVGLHLVWQTLSACQQSGTSLDDTIKTLNALGQTH